MRRPTTRAHYVYGKGLRNRWWLIPLAAVSLVLALSAVTAFGVTSRQNHLDKTYHVSAWSPAANDRLSGEQTFQSTVADLSVDEYQMYWFVEEQPWQRMESRYEPRPHKAAMVNVSAWSPTGSIEAARTLTYVAVNNAGEELGRTDVKIYTELPGEDTTTQPSTTPTPSAPKPAAATAVSGAQTGAATFANRALYIEPDSNATDQAAQWRSTRPQDAALMDKLASQPQAKWIGDWNPQPKSEVNTYVAGATQANALPVLVLYNIPNRDCGGYSAGGAKDGAAYLEWIRGVASGIANRTTLVVLEPDALANLDCLDTNGRTTRINLIKDATAILKAQIGVAVYLDIGHPRWLSTDQASARLLQAGISAADGFSLNVSNFVGNAENLLYGETISRNTGGKHFVIDTSRNGQGPAPGDEWCNPNGRGLGSKPTTVTGQALVDAYLWIKAPGESDGACNGAPEAGVWWPEYALGLAQRASW